MGSKNRTRQRREESLAIDDLEIRWVTHVDEVELYWSGRGDLRDPMHQLEGFIHDLVESMAGRPLVVDFRALTYINSRTVSPLLELFKMLNAEGIESTLIFDTSVPWQRVTYHSMQAAARVLHLLNVLSLDELRAEEDLAGIQTHLEARLDALEPPNDARIVADLVIHEGEGWFEWDGRRVDIARRRSLRSILTALAQHSTQANAGGLGMVELLQQGWPELRVYNSSVHPRVYVAICSLRRLGLDGVLIRDAEGYRLSPHVQVTFVGD